MNILGLSNFITHFYELFLQIDSKTYEYLPRPIFLSHSYIYADLIICLY